MHSQRSRFYWQGVKDFLVKNMLQMVVGGEKGGGGESAKKDFTGEPVCSLKSRNSHKGYLRGILKSDGTQTQNFKISKPLNS